ncbi:MAG: competence/damage-inducible protein A [Vicinamibacterales bacterium]
MKPLTRAAIIAVGSELLTPLRLDTNSLFITEQLNTLGIDVVLKAVAGDDRGELAELFRAALARVDMVVFTGGLGPTDDDVTREVVAGTLGRALTEDTGITERMRVRFAARGYKGPMPEINRRQAMVPAGARVIENERGSAPGLWLEEGDTVVLLLPGPPRELKPMLLALAGGSLRARAAGAPLLRRVVRIAGVIESQTDEALQPLYREWAANTPRVNATILAALGQIELHLWTQAATADDAGATLDRAVQEVGRVMGDNVFSTDGRSMEAVVGDLLVSRGYRIALAESCTGGLLTSRLTDVPGSSRYVERAVIAYANEAKTELLDVDPAVIAAHGAVSEAVAQAMAEGVRSRAGVDVGVGVTGIAGPGGGSAEKPVGTVAIAAVAPSAARSRMFRFHGEREHVKFQASQAALDIVRRMLG